VRAGHRQSVALFNSHQLIHPVSLPFLFCPTTHSRRGLRILLLQITQDKCRIICDQNMATSKIGSPIQPNNLMNLPKNQCRVHLIISLFLTLTFFSVHKCNDRWTLLEGEAKPADYSMWALASSSQCSALGPNLTLP